MSKFESTFNAIQTEVNQRPSQRLPYLREIEQLRSGRTVLSFFSSFSSNIALSAPDADMIEEVLINSDNAKGVSLLLDSPGGDGLTAERIIQICRNYSRGDFEVIVPARAKSAATMVCLGADQILMSPTSELGPIDPQVLFDMGQGVQWTPAHSIITTYDELFKNAVNLKDGEITPYLQQLGHFNAVYVKQLRTAAALSEKIAVSSLGTGMMAKKKADAIKNKIKPFLDPDYTSSHGRGITADLAKQCDLKVVDIDPSSELWKSVWGLYLRSKFVVENTQVSTLIETKENSLIAMQH